MAGREPKPPEGWDDASLTPPGSPPPPESDKKPGLGGVGTPAGQH
jgi:hypothetical protein